MLAPLGEPADEHEQVGDGLETRDGARQVDSRDERASRRTSVRSSALDSRDSRTRVPRSRDESYFVSLQKRERERESEREKRGVLRARLCSLSARRATLVTSLTKLVAAARPTIVARSTSVSARSWTRSSRATHGRREFWQSARPRVGRVPRRVSPLPNKTLRGSLSPYAWDSSLWDSFSTLWGNSLSLSLSLVDLRVDNSPRRASSEEPLSLYSHNTSKPPGQSKGPRPREES